MQYGIPGKFQYCCDFGKSPGNVVSTERTDELALLLNPWSILDKPETLCPM
jgi:hypothetical protein